ncbi:MAG: glycosyltransferase, partial [Gammaproteobacteria bacterium]|nr:glycosyltransferase [Gammaproteobacteria bacterium]
FIAGTPCITTDIGYEGMANNLAWGGLVAEKTANGQQNEQQIAQYAIDLYENTSLWHQSSQNGQLIIQEIFNEHQHADAFILRLQRLISTLPKHRQNNFFGQILRHNLYRSQYFMSKWIEEKNKEPSIKEN